MKIFKIMFLLAVLLVFKINSAQLKIYVNTDLEGISGVFNFNQTREKGLPV